MKNTVSSDRAAKSRLRGEPGGIRVAAYLPEDLEEALRVYCARERRSISNALAEAVRDLLAKTDTGNR